jgi:hypothetical protein
MEVVAIQDTEPLAVIATGSPQAKGNVSLIPVGNLRTNSRLPKETFMAASTGNAGGTGAAQPEDCLSPRILGTQ